MNDAKLFNVFTIEQQSKDFVPVSGRVVIKDNVEWDEDMINDFKQLLAEHYDCSPSEIKHSVE